MERWKSGTVEWWSCSEKVPGMKAFERQLGPSWSFLMGADGVDLKLKKAHEAALLSEGDRIVLA